MHLTDVMEDADGSLLVLDTGGWLTRGCPSSLGGDAGARGGVYRIRAKHAPRIADPYGRNIAWNSLSPAEVATLQADRRWRVREAATRMASAGTTPPVPAAADLHSAQPHIRLRACERLAQAKRIDTSQRVALRDMLGGPLEPVLEHAALYAAIATKAFDLEALRAARSSVLLRWLAVVVEQTAENDAVRDALVGVVKAQVDSADAELARTAIAVIGRHPRAVELCHDDLVTRPAQPAVSQRTIELIPGGMDRHVAAGGVGRARHWPGDRSPRDDRALQRQGSFEFLDVAGHVRCQQAGAWPRGS